MGTMHDCWVGKVVVIDSNRLRGARKYERRNRDEGEDIEPDTS